MQPWMIIAVLMLAGLALLLIAPRVHRRSTARARAAAAAHHLRRAEELRTDPEAVEHRTPDAEYARRLRDALLLRGVRAEVEIRGDRAVLIARRPDSASVEEIRAMLDRERRS